MISPNIQALKVSDNLKWDFQAGYQKALQIFNYSGEATEEYKKASQELIAQMTTIVSEANILIKEAEKVD